MGKLTDTPVTKRGLALQYACRNIDKLHNVVIQIPEDQVECEEGLNNVLHVLDNFYSFDHNKSAVEYFNKFMSLKRKEHQSITQFIVEFDTLYSINKRNGNILADYLLAYLLLKTCNISDITKRIVIATNTDLTYTNVKETLKRIFMFDTIKPTPTEGQSDSTMTNVKKNEEEGYCVHMYLDKPKKKQKDKC